MFNSKKMHEILPRKSTTIINFMPVNVQFLSKVPPLNVPKSPLSFNMYTFVLANVQIWPVMLLQMVQFCENVIWRPVKVQPFKKTHP